LFTNEELDTIILLCSRIFETAAFSNISWEFLARVEKVQDTAQKLRSEIAWDDARREALAQS
jgi:hypothetical protein